jgi:hypothetical protein
MIHAQILVRGANFHAYTLGKALKEMPHAPPVLIKKQRTAWLCTTWRLNIKQYNT